jgi:hypothetical protein
MPDREDFPIPSVINPPTSRGICVPVPDDPVYMTVFAGLIQELTFWFNWQRDPEKRGKDAAHVWLEIFNNIDWLGGDCMGCCEDRTVLHRVGAGGALEVSTDGGTTWHSDPSDPRITGTALANTIPGSDDTKKCNAATNAVENFKDAQSSFGASLSTASTIIGLALAIASEVALLLFSAGTAAEILVPLMISTATALFGVLETTYNAEFTETVWDTLTCDIFCTVGADGQFTASGLIDLQARVDADFSDNVALTFQSILTGWGLIGLNNACIAGVSATADCSECPACVESCSDKFTVRTGTLLGIFDGYMRIESVASGGAEVVQIDTGDADQCCQLLDFRFLSGEDHVTAKYHILCSLPIVEGNINPGWGLETCYNFMAAQTAVGDGTVFVVEILLNFCD